ncbi:MAG: amylo-alpha-1,6-glucosidase [Candidatus Planktophila sp.]
MDELKAGEKTVNYEVILEDNDSALNPANRPHIDEAVEMILGSAHGFEVPFAAVPLKEHKNLPEQNLYSCLFGRDSLLIADLLFNVKPHLRMNVIQALALVQGSTVDYKSEEEPGRIAHEVRTIDDPVARKLQDEGDWKFPYYGSVDATLIWMKQVSKAAEADPSILDIMVGGLALWERFIASTQWLVTRLDTSSGFIESSRSNPKGIANQVWKDSGDSYMHANGVLARGDSTASVETVGETYDAILAAVAVQLLKPSKKWPLSTSELSKLARHVQLSLIGHFWMGDSFALGLERSPDGGVTKFESLASNQGRLLDSGVISGDEFSQYRNAIAAVMTDSSMLGDSGLRTLARTHVSYRPGGYHTGSAWPFDGVLTARGLLKHGFIKESQQVQARIKNAIESSGGYPEFFRGDWPEKDLINRFIQDVQFDDESGVRAHTNRIAQPPQIIQGWTVAAYSWLTSRD